MSNYGTARALACGILLSGLTLPMAWASENHNATEFSATPVEITQEGARPRVMINASNDHQLFFKVYTDYNDLDGDGEPDITYKNSINYYGYFDSYKCYDYNESKGRFEPRAFTTDKYCTGANDQYWSGNFLNWVTMARIDAVRKILFGGHRRVDSATETVLERTFLPHDSHAWAKFYSGADLPKLTPYKLAASDEQVRGGSLYYYCDDEHLGLCGGGKNNVKLGVTFGNVSRLNSSATGQKSEKIDARDNPPVMQTAPGNYSLWAANEGLQLVWKNDGKGPADSGEGYNRNDDPSLSGIYAHNYAPSWANRLGRGDYTVRVLACVPGLIDDAAVNAVPGHTKERCKLYPGPDGLVGTDDDNYKPIGLLQTYGDDEQMYFGQVSGSYYKHTKGGILTRNIKSITEEVKTGTDGSFPLVAQFAGGPKSNTQAKGMINAWSTYRLVGAQFNNNNYHGGDDCAYLLVNRSAIAADGRCRSWGNPFAEMYAQSLYYLGGKGGTIAEYNPGSQDTNMIPGLSAPEAFADPLSEDEYCAPLSIINFNSSVISYDDDNLDSSSNFQPAMIWDSAELPANATTINLTDIIGQHEGLYDGTSKYFFGQKNLAAGSVGSGDNDQLCTPKLLASLGEAGGICPEAPRLYGSYRTAGLAYYSHIADMRPDSDSSRNISGIQTADNYSVALAAAVPVIEVPEPGGGKSPVTILPACRMTYNDSQIPGNCAIIDFKIVSQEISGSTAKGKFYIVWEDSEQGADNDQDMWGTLEYEYNSTTKKLKVTTKAQVNSAGGPEMGFGYVLGGTNDNGFHVHSGIHGFYWAASRDDSGRNNCSVKPLHSTKTSIKAGCYCRHSASAPNTLNIDEFGACAGEEASSKTYDVVAAASVKQLEDPLWYAAKWGGFIDINGNKIPDLQEEWDSVNNATGASGMDGIPDNYFYATNPKQLEDSLDRVFSSILGKISSSAAAAVTPSSTSSTGAVYQATYEPARQNGSAKVRWLGSLTALWSDEAGYTRQDCTPDEDNGIDPATGRCKIYPNGLAGGTCTPNGVLDSYCVDPVVELKYNADSNGMMGHVNTGIQPDKYVRESMEGVVQEFIPASGTLTVIPFSMEGKVTFDAAANELTLAPDTMTGETLSYDPRTGEVTLSVTGVDGVGAASQWAVSTAAGSGKGTADGSQEFSMGTKALTVFPAGDWLTGWITPPTYNESGVITEQGVPSPTQVTLKSKHIVGTRGSVFSNWYVECTNGSSATGEVNGTSLALDDSSTVARIPVSAVSGSFAGCTRARFSTYNLRGAAGTTVNGAIEVTNTGSKASSSASGPLTLANHGVRNLNVALHAPWLTAGDTVRLNTDSRVTIDADEVGYLWNARQQLYLPGLSDAELAANRNYEAPANEGRHIMTWIDADQNGQVNNGEYQPFVTSVAEGSGYKYFDVNTQAEAEDVINYVRGIEIPGTRSRTIKYSTHDVGTNVMRLGDIIHSTPVVVSAPSEGYDLSYGDETYLKFCQRYSDRRTMVYVGANDGLLHAFNGGFYTTEDSGDGTIHSFLVNGKKPDGTTAVAHPLGSEIWAYAPHSLLPHLQWLKDENYGAATHVYYVDGQPRSLDAKIFASDADHPEGWGTILVVGLNLGGAPMNITSPAGACTTRPAYLVFDITNPEVEPKLLGEIPLPDATFTTVIPSVVAMQEVNGNGVSSWYLMLGNGPTDMHEYTSNKNATVYAFNLKQLVENAGSSSGTPSGCTEENMSPFPDSFKILSCETDVPNGFISSPAVVDWDLDFKANAAYIGVVSTNSAQGTTGNNSGALLKLDFNNDPNPSSWSWTHFFDTGLPVSSWPSVGLDANGNKWVYFGTGRYWSQTDKLTKDQHYFYGIKDSGFLPISDASLIDVSGIEIIANGEHKGKMLDASLSFTTLPSPVGTLSDFNELREAAGKSAVSGWKRKLPYLVGSSPDPTTRSITDPTLYGGTVFASIYQPSSDPCEGEGWSKIFAWNYLTGTGDPDNPAFGIKTVLMDGIPTLVAEISSDIFSNIVRVTVTDAGQVNTNASGGNVNLVENVGGELEQENAETSESTKSGRVSWRDLGEDEED